MTMTAFSQAHSGPAALFDRAPILVFGSSHAARNRGAEAVAASGLRLAAALPVEEGIARLDLQGSASAVWIELDEDAVERTAALALALHAGRGGNRLSDIAADNSAARLRQLSDEVGRIAATLATLSHGPAGHAPASVQFGSPQPSAAPLPEVSREQLRGVIRARRIRARFFAEDLFADPAWDMLLDLMHAELAQIRVPVSSLCIAASVPATTALRWIKTLNDRGLISRRADPHDGRRVFVELSNEASSAIRRYFGEVGHIAGV